MTPWERNWGKQRACLGHTDQSCFTFGLDNVVSRRVAFNMSRETRSPNLCVARSYVSDRRQSAKSDTFVTIDCAFCSKQCFQPAVVHPSTACLGRVSCILPVGLVGRWILRSKVGWSIICFWSDCRYCLRSTVHLWFDLIWALLNSEMIELFTSLIESYKYLR